HLRRDDHVLGEPAVVVVPHRLLRVADGHPPAPALRARPVGDGGDDLDAVARRPAGDALAGLGDLAGDLVAHHPRRGDVVVPEPGDLDVGAARRAVAHADLQLAGAGLRFGRVLQPDVAGCVETGDLHTVCSCPVCGESVVCSSSPRGARRAMMRSGASAWRSSRALSGSMRTWASSARISMWPSPRAAIAMHTVTGLPFQSVPSGNRTKASASRWMRSRPSLVPCGMATPSPR